MNLLRWGMAAWFLASMAGQGLRASVPAPVESSFSQDESARRWEARPAAALLAAATPTVSAPSTGAISEEQHASRSAGSIESGAAGVPRPAPSRTSPASIGRAPPRS